MSEDAHARIRRTSAKLAVTTRYKGADAPETTEARRDLAAIKIKTYVEELLAAAPPLSDEQRALVIAALGGVR